MGKRGPAPKPTNLRVLHGDRADRINTDEPTPATVAVEPPAWLVGEPLEIWEHFAPDLKRKGVLTGWDTEAFAALCDAAARRRKAAAQLRAEGEVVELPVFNKAGDATGVRLVRNPWLLVLNQADAQLVTYSARFGMTPSDRSQLRGGTRSRDPHDDLLTG